MSEDIGNRVVLITGANRGIGLAILLNKDTGENAISVVPGAAGALTIEDIDNVWCLYSFGLFAKISSRG